MENRCRASSLRQNNVSFHSHHMKRALECYVKTVAMMYLQTYATKSLVHIHAILKRNCKFCDQPACPALYYNPMHVHMYLQGIKQLQMEPVASGTSGSILADWYYKWEDNDQKGKMHTVSLLCKVPWEHSNSVLFFSLLTMFIIQKTPN